MHEKVVEIILFIINELRYNKNINDIDISLLIKKGYTQSEISYAFTWLFEKLANGNYLLTDKTRNNSFRLLNENEKMVIESEAYGYLIQCQQLGILNNNEIEHLIERVVLTGFSSIGLNEMKSIVAAYLFNIENQNVLISLGNNETIH